MEAPEKTVWITWEKQTRNRSMARALGVPLFVIHSDRKRFVRYLSCIGRTVLLLWRERPAIAIGQNPSVVLTLLLLGLRRLFGFRVAIDAHFGGIEAYIGGGKWFQAVLNYCNRAADLVIVTNESHASTIRESGGRAFVCPDPLPDLSAYDAQVREIPRKIFLICSFDPDEPFREVFHAAESLGGEGFRLFVSGNFRKAGIALDEFPHVHFLGYVPEAEFYRHLFSAQVIVDLTDCDNCLVCGAYESLEAGKPLVLSNKKALTDYFTGGTVFTENRAPEIAAAVKRAYADRLRLAAESRQWVTNARAEMRGRIGTLNDILTDLCRPGRGRRSRTGWLRSQG